MSYESNEMKPPNRLHPVIKYDLEAPFREDVENNERRSAKMYEVLNWMDRTFFRAQKNASDNVVNAANDARSIIAEYNCHFNGKPFSNKVGLTMANRMETAWNTLCDEIGNANTNLQ